MKNSIGLMAIGVLAMVVVGCNKPAASNNSESSDDQASNSKVTIESDLCECCAVGNSTPKAPSAHARPVLVLNSNVLLSEDPIRAEALKKSIEAFLTQAVTGDFTEDTVDPEELNRHRVFYRRVGGFGETPGIGVPSVLKAYTLNGEDYFVTIAFGGEVDGVPFLDMIVELKATPHDKGYRFHCPFEERTKDFDETTIDDVCFRYSGGFNEDRARQFVATRAELSRVSGVRAAPLEYFAFQSLDEMLKSYGLVFDKARCNFLGHDLGRFDDDFKRYATGMGNECYLFGYVHCFLRSLDHDASDRNTTMTAGFQTLYGGYWLIGTPMEDLKNELRETVKQTPEIDLLDLFNKGRNGQTEGHAPSWVMAALICERTLEKRNFQDLLRLIYSGSNGERFFGELQAVLGIDEAGFQEAIVEMLKPEPPMLTHFVTHEGARYQELVEQFREFVAPYLSIGKSQPFQFSARSRRFGHLSRPWETTQQALEGTFLVDNGEFKLDEAVARTNGATETQLAYSDESLWMSRDGVATNTTVSNHRNYLKKSCRYTPQLLLQHCLIALKSEAEQEKESGLSAEEIPSLALIGNELILKSSYHNEEFHIRFSVNDSTLNSITWHGHHEFWGNENTVFTYTRTSDGQDHCFPQQVRETQFDTVTFHCEINAGDKGSELDLIEIPEGHVLKTAAAQPEFKMEVKEFSERIRLLELSHTDSRSLLVEFDEFLMVIDAPTTSLNGQFMIDRIKELEPVKPIKYFAFGHHHPHYLGGVRAFIANGTTIISPKTVSQYVRQLASHDFSRHPDRLQNQPLALNMTVFENELEIGDENYKIKMFDIGQASLHTNDYLLFYFPTERLLFQDDGIWVRKSPGLNARTKATYAEIVKLKLDIEKCVQGWPTQHYGVQTVLNFKELVEKIKDENSAKPTNGSSTSG